MVDRLIREKLLGCGRNHEAKKNRLSLHSPTGSPNQQQQQYRAMSRSPRPQSQQEHCALGTGTSLLGQPRPQLGSPCPAITSWPAPPPRADLKPTAIAAPLLGMGGSPTTSFLRSNLVHPSSPLPSPMAPSPQPNPHPRLELPEDNNSAQLLSMLRAMAGSTSAGTSSPGGGYRGGRETELRQKIQALEEIVAEYERQKFNVLGTFSDFRERVAERERRLEADYSSRIIDLSEEVLGAKKDFEERMKSFQLLQEQFEREKEQALEKLRQDHQREIQTLEHALEQRYIVWKEQRYSESQLLNLEQKYLLEIQRLEEERKLLRAERERFSQDFEVKLRRAESLFESELTAAKIMYTRELQALREHEEALKDELAARQEEFHERLAELQHQSRQAKDELGHCREEVTQLEWKLREKAAEIQRLAKELAIARRQAEQAARRLGEAHSQAEQGQRRLEEQKAELERRAAQLEAAEETQARLEQTVKELRTEVKALRNRVELLEVERDGLRAQAESQTQLHDSQLTALEAMLESVTRDKDICAERYEDNLQKERAQAEEREASLRCEFSTKLGELEEQYNGLREHVEQESGPENEKLWEEIESLRAEKRELEDETDAAAVEKHEQMVKIAQAIGSLEKKAGMGKPADEEGKAEKKRRLEGANEEGEEKEDAKDEEEEASISAEELLRRLNDLERSVEGIVREKEQTEARLQQLQEYGPEGGWTRAQELERELAEQKDRTAELEKGHREAVAELQAQLTKMEANLAEKGEAGSEGEANKQRERADQLEKELLEAEERLEEAREAAEQELRQMEEEGALALELKISALNREHERTVELMQLREQEMAEQLELLKGRQRPETGEEQTQTELESTELEMPSKETVAVEETERLAEEMERMRQREQKREELIRQLQAELTEAQQHRESQGIGSSSNSGGNKDANRPKKENRSQSIASASDHLAFCQRTAAAAAASSGRSMLEELAGQQRKECQKSGPGLLERRGLAGRMEATVPQEMSPPHHHQHSAGPSSSSQRLLSPTASAQRTSPSRQMFFAAGKGAPTGAATEKSERRPAWKF